MKNKIIIVVFLVGLVLLSMSKFGFAGVAGDMHDMTVSGGGTDANLCSYCHIPHNAIGDKIWSDWHKSAMPSGYSPMGNMCYTCHDGTLAALATVFNSSLQQHKVTTGQDCDMCHSVHDNTNQKFTSVAKKEDSYCAACHDGIVDAGGFGDMTGAGNHQSYWNSTPAHDYFGKPTGADCNICHKDSYKSDDGSCNLCHTPHGAVNYSKGSITNPILNRDNILDGMESYYCAVCHPEKNSYGVNVNKHPAQKATGS